MPLHPKFSFSVFLPKKRPSGAPWLVWTVHRYFFVNKCIFHYFFLHLNIIMALASAYETMQHWSDWSGYLTKAQSRLHDPQWRLFLKATVKHLRSNRQLEYSCSVLKIKCLKMAVCGRTRRSLRMSRGTGEVQALQWWAEVAGHQFPWDGAWSTQSRRGLQKLSL